MPAHHAKREYLQCGNAAQLIRQRPPHPCSVEMKGCSNNHNKSFDMNSSSKYQCQHISSFPGSENYGEFDVQVVRRSAASGCAPCSILWAVVKPHVKENNEGSHLLGFNGSGSGLGIRGTLPSGYLDTEVFSTEDCGGFIPKARFVSDTTESEAAFSQIMTWFAACVNTHHTLCNRMSTTDYLPSRVLDLGSGGPGETIVLRETSDQVGRYACLSHSWGGCQPLQTTKETIEEHKKGILWDTLPKTFQHAAVYARRLTIQYLWIDSLCIIQNDAEDWMINAAQMANIYRNAAITLSAAASKGPNDGFYTKIRPKHIAVELPTIAQDARKPKIYTRTPLPHMRSDHPLLDRGWVLQERLLSPRVLHFGTFELIWECMEKRDCECGQVPNGIFWYDTKSKHHPDILAALPARFAAHAWRKLAEDFSKLKLTYRMDVLPAVSGAAKVVKQSLESKGIQATYLAGMWDCWFIEDCLWSASLSSSEISARPSEWQAPTFSWMSVACGQAGYAMYKALGLFESASGNRQGEDHIDPKVLTIHALLKDFSYALKSADETGPIKSASVVLSGPLLKSTFNHNELVVHGQAHSFYPEFDPDYDFSLPGKHHIATGSNLVCLQLVSLKAPSANPVHQYLWCLVLRSIEVNVGEECVYERVGLLRYREDVTSPVEKWFKLAFVEEGAVVRII